MNLIIILIETNMLDNKACWNCRLYDDCEKKYYITAACSKYISVNAEKYGKNDSEPSNFCDDEFKV